MKERFQQMVDSLRANSRVRVIKSEFDPPATSDEIETARKAAGGHLPEGLESLCRELNGFRLEWHHTIPEIAHHDQSDGGFINLLPIREIFAERKGDTWFENAAPFDVFQPEACACFRQEPGAAVEDDVRYQYSGEEPGPPLCTFPQYLDRLLESRGYWYWIRALQPEASTEAQNFLSAMGKIFPDFRADLFQPKR